MDIETFTRHLLVASERARDFAAEIPADEMPAHTRYLILYPRTRPLDWLRPDGSPFSIATFHDGRFPEPRRFIGPVDAIGAVEFLWREGSVPKWINLGVYATDGEFTCLEVIFSGQFLRDDGALYYGPSFEAGGLMHDLPPFTVVREERPHLPTLSWKPTDPGESELRFR